MEIHHEIRHMLDRIDSLRDDKKQLERMVACIEHALLLWALGWHSNNHVIGYWNCHKSPITTCVYDISKDPMHDHCIFCGGPEERK